MLSPSPPPLREKNNALAADTSQTHTPSTTAPSRRALCSWPKCCCTADGWLTNCHQRGFPPVFAGRLPWLWRCWRLVVGAAERQNGRLFTGLQVLGRTRAEQQPGVLTQCRCCCFVERAAIPVQRNATLFEILKYIVRIIKIHCSGTRLRCFCFISSSLSSMAVHQQLWLTRRPSHTSGSMVLVALVA